MLVRSLHLLSSAAPLLHFFCSSAALLRACTCCGCQLLPHRHHLGLDAHGVSSSGSLRERCCSISWCAGQGTNPTLAEAASGDGAGQSQPPSATFGQGRLKREMEGMAKGCPVPHQTLLHSIRLLAEVEGEPQEEQSPFPAAMVPDLCTPASLWQYWLWGAELTPFSVSQLQTVNL